MEPDVWTDRVLHHSGRMLPNPPCLVAMKLLKLRFEMVRIRNPKPEYPANNLQAGTVDPILSILLSLPMSEDF